MVNQYVRTVRLVRTWFLKKGTGHMPVLFFYGKNTQQTYFCDNIIAYDKGNARACFPLCSGRKYKSDTEAYVCG